jgi:L-asparaginase
MNRKIVVLGTGGTIAGVALDAFDNVSYVAAQVSVEQLLLNFKGFLEAFGPDKLVCEQVVQIDSKDMGWQEWRAIAMRVEHHLSLPDVSAIVISHGTDTLEETAFFLSQVLSRDSLATKAVVLTCAMRPSSSLASDGPRNLRDALVVSTCRGAKGVLAVCAGSVHAAHYVQKVHPYRLDAFDSGEAGPLGYVEEGRVRWLGSPSDVVIAKSTISIYQLPTQCPRVEIVMSHAGSSGSIVFALCASSGTGEAAVEGIVVAGTGNGTIHAELESALRHVQNAGVRVVRTTRCPYGQIVDSTDTSNALPHFEGLSPVKARIALMLDLIASS